MKNKTLVRIFLLFVLLFFIGTLLFIAFQYFQKKQQFKNYDSQRMSAFDNLVREDDQDKLKKYKDLLGKYPLPGYSFINYDERMGDIYREEDGRVKNAMLTGVSNGQFKQRDLYNFNGAHLGKATIGEFYILNKEANLILVDVILGIEVSDENGARIDILRPLQELVLQWQNIEYSEDAFYDLLSKGDAWQLIVFDRTDWPVMLPGYKALFLDVFKPSDLEKIHSFVAGSVSGLDTPPLFLFTMMKWDTGEQQ